METDREYCFYPQKDDSNSFEVGYGYKHSFVDMCDLISYQTQQFLNLLFLILLLISQIVLLVYQYNKDVKSMYKFHFSNLFACGSNSIKHFCSLKAIVWMTILTFTSSLLMFETVVV